MILLEFNLWLSKVKDVLKARALILLAFLAFLANRPSRTRFLQGKETHLRSVRTAC
jgi:hypothetical protein